MACSSRPATGTSWAGSPVAILDPLRESELHRLFTIPSHFGSNIRVLLRRRARNAPDQVDERRLWMGVTWPVQLEAAPGIVVSGHHQAPQTESAECTGSSSHDCRPFVGPVHGAQHSVPAPWRASVRLSCGQLGARPEQRAPSRSQRRVMEPADRAGQSESSDWHRRVCASSCEGRRPRHTSREPAPHRPSAGRSGNNTTDLGVSPAGKPGTR